MRDDSQQKKALAGDIAGQVVIEPQTRKYERIADLFSEGKLDCSECTACGAGFYPPVDVCRTCNSSAVEPVRVEAKGNLYSYTTVAVSPTFEAPYTLGYVDLAVQFTGGLRVLGIVELTPEALACDVPVRAAVSESSPVGWSFVKGTKS